MGLKIGQFFVVVFVLSGVESEAKSLGAIQAHKLTRRQLSSVVWEDMCPPPAFIDEIKGKNCTDTCHSNDYCLGRKLCCEIGGCKSCMDPVLPPAVIDWVDNKVPAPPGNETDNTINLEKPHYEHVECFFEGKSYPKGVIYRGCRRCFCNDEGELSCEVGPCRAAEKTVTYTDKEKAPNYEGSGSDDESDEERASPLINKHISNEFRPFKKDDGKKYHEVEAPKVEFIAYNPPSEKHNNEIKVAHESEKEQSGNGESGDGESGDGELVEIYGQRHSSKENKNKKHENEVDGLHKVDDIFLI